MVCHGVMVFLNISGHNWWFLFSHGGSRDPSSVATHILFRLKPWDCGIGIVATCGIKRQDVFFLLRNVEHNFFLGGMKILELLEVVSERP